MLRRLANKSLQICESCNKIGQVQQKRTELVFRRMYPPRLWKEGEKRSLKKREFVYIVEENTNARPVGELELILTTDIKELGNEGELIKVHKRIAHNHLLPLGMAVYASPENLAKYEEKRKGFEGIKKQTKTGYKVIKQLEGMTLPIPMNPKADWVIDKKHLRIAFRRVGVYLDEDAITLPDEPVTEFGNIQVNVMVNGLDNVTVNAVVVEYNKDTEYFPDIEVWKDVDVNIETMIEEAYVKMISERHKHAHS